MSKTQINVRVDADLKAQAELLYKQLGLKMSDVITMLLRQSLYHQGVPFEVKLPSKKRRAALQEADNYTDLPTYNTIQEVYAELGIKG